jgi:AcrR family transcriptional regulator
LPINSPEASPRPMRADALRNRARLLDAAERVFATRGVGVPIDAVAEEAGVGAGTLYRHFPTKEALFEAIVVDRLEKLVATAHDAADSTDVGHTFFAFLQHFAGQAALKRDLYDALTVAGVDVKSQCASLISDLESEIGRMLDNAKQAGAVRSDVTGQDVIGLVIGACHVVLEGGLDTASSERMVAVVCDGLRVHSS